MSTTYERLTYKKACKGGIEAKVAVLDDDSRDTAQWVVSENGIYEPSTSMEPLYPQNILERKYPILREQREKAEREAVDEKRRLNESLAKVLEEYESDATLYENEPVEEGLVGLHLNTLA